MTGPILVSPLYTDPALAALYDPGDPPRADFTACKRLARDAASVLDLGCGTGRLAIALAHGRDVTGVDPAPGMLAAARARAGADRVNWVEASAETLRLDRVFDLIVLTGHAFQVFLTPDRQAAVLASIAAHLAPGGRFVFDTRNPGFPEPKERSTHQTRRRFHHPDLGPIEAWNVSRYDEATGILTYTNAYRILDSGELRQAEDRIRYTPQPELARLIAGAGLRVDDWWGDWSGSPYHTTAKEIIPLGRRAA